MNKKYFFIFIFAVAVLILSSYYIFKSDISNVDEIGLKNNDYLTKLIGKNYNEIINDIKKQFTAKFKSFYQKPYGQGESNSPDSYLNVKYVVDRIVLYTTKSKQFPLKAFVYYTHIREGIDNDNISFNDTDKNSTYLYLYDINNKKWKTAVLSWWIIPCIFLIAVIILSVIMKFIKTAEDNSKNEDLDQNKNNDPYSVTDTQSV